MPDRRLVAVDVAIKVATVLLLAWAVLSPDLPQFTGKAFTGRAVAYPIALAVLPIGWWLLGRPRGFAFPVVADILLGLPFLIDVAGNALDLYDAVEWWDDANHLVNWGLHTAAVGLLLRAGDWGQWTRATHGIRLGGEHRGAVGARGVRGLRAEFAGGCDGIRGYPGRSGAGPDRRCDRGGFGQSASASESA